MRLSRLFINHSLSVGQQYTLPLEVAHYLIHVLRLPLSAPVTLFNGQGGEYWAQLTAIHKKQVVVEILGHQIIERESPLVLTLVQAISRPEHMDYTVQKAVELGVQQIIPLISERSPPVTHLLPKRLEHWHKIIISACEQSGRNRLPELHKPLSLTEWLQQSQAKHRIVLSPEGSHTLQESLQQPDAVTVLIGAEGGFSATEMQQILQADYIDVRLGSRILRTETAATALLAICQGLWGDLGSLV